MRALDFRQLSPRNQSIALAIVVVFGVVIGFLTNPNDGWDGVLRTLTWLSFSLIFHYLIIWFRAYPEIEYQHQNIRIGSTLGFVTIIRITIGTTLYFRSTAGDFAALSGAVFALYAILYVLISAWLARWVSRSDRVQGR